MRIYSTPVILNEEPRIVGGKLTLRQAVYVVSGIAISCRAFARFVTTGKLGSVLAVSAIVIPLSLLLAFFKVPNTDLYLDRYLILLMRFKKKHAYAYIIAHPWRSADREGFTGN